MATMKETSRMAWRSDTSVSDINAGSFQRIADALEKIAVNKGVEKLLHQIAGLRGVITRMKKQTKKG